MIKVRILKEVYKKKSCEKKTGESGNCEVTTSKGKSCYDSCEEAAGAIESSKNEEESLEEVSSGGGGAVSGGVVPTDDDPIEEMYSTSSGHNRGRWRAPPVDEFAGYKERSAYQKLKNVPPPRRRLKIRFKR